MPFCSGMRGIDKLIILSYYKIIAIIKIVFKFKVFIMKKIAVLVSGGVDSSVALANLVHAGYSPTAFYLKIWLEDELAYLGECPWQEDLSYVKAVCEQLGVPLEVVSLQRAYWDEVVTYTIAQIKAGCTPNPDIMCNTRVKFGAFLKHIGDSYDKVATGHYAQVFTQDGLAVLKTSPDLIKDQTYFLSQLTQVQLQKALFPIGHLIKKEVRALAHTYNLPNKDRKDSQGICFLGKIKFSDFIKHHVGIKPGALIEYETGEKIGEHEGTWFYTIGQRQGIGLSGGPWYVVKKSLDDNIVFISRSYYAADKNREMVSVHNFNWISGAAPEQATFLIKLRHGPVRVPGTLSYTSTGGVIKLAENDQGIASGQFAAFYDNKNDGNICLGSAVIVDN